MTPEQLPLLLWCIGISFAAGKAYADARRNRKDIDGLRQIFNATADLTQEQFLHTVTVLMVLTEGKDQKMALDLLTWMRRKR